MAKSTKQNINQELIRPHDQIFISKRVKSSSLADPSVLSKEQRCFLGPNWTFLDYPLGLELEIAGKIIVLAQAQIGWSHRGTEKACEQVSYKEALDVVSRVNPSFPQFLALAYVMALEKFFDKTISCPTSLRKRRLAVVESARVCSHLLVIQNTCLSYFGRRILKLMKESIAQSEELLTILSGDPCEHAWINNTDVKTLPHSHKQTAKQIIQTLLKAAAHLNKELDSRRLSKVLANIGSISKSKALSLGLSGPSLKACGVNYDLRLKSTSLPYETKFFLPINRSSGDALARLQVRALEVIASLQMILEMLANSEANSSQPENESQITNFFPKSAPPKGREHFSIESPEGQLTISIASDGSLRPYRVRIRSPHFALAQSLGEFLLGSKTNDVLPIIHSLGLNTFEADR